MNYFNKYFIRIIISVLLFVPFVNAYDTLNSMEQDLMVIEIGPKIIVTLGSKIIYSSEQ